MKRIWACLLVILSVSAAVAQEVIDSVECSLITCSPGSEIYQQFGHTALRCRNFTRGTDWVFNYGVFSFNQPNFIWRFIRGECDYMVDAMPWKYFPLDYEKRGSSITAQVLNLTPEESYNLYRNLVINSRPENCEYRYNFLYNNCTTQVRDQIERAVNGRVEYPQSKVKQTYREILHSYTANYPWSREGEDFLLGAAVDTILTDRATMFAPEYLQNFAAGAVIRQLNGDSKPLVKKTEILLHEKPVATESEFPLTPLAVGLCFLALCFLVFAIEFKWGHQLWLFDVLILLAQGLVGILLTFMFFFSQHPAVNSNWLIWLFHPFALVGIPMVIKSSIQKRRTIWHGINFAILTLFIVFSAWIPQDFGEIVVPLALAMLTRPLSYHVYYQRKRIE